MTTFDYRFYTRSKSDHPSDKHSTSEDLKDIAEWYLDSLSRLNGERSFNCLVSWVGADGENASIRYDSFMSNGLKVCLGHPEEQDVLRDFYQTIQDYRLENTRHG